MRRERRSRVVDARRIAEVVLQPTPGKSSSTIRRGRQRAARTTQDIATSDCKADRSHPARAERRLRHDDRSPDVDVVASDERPAPTWVVIGPSCLPSRRRDGVEVERVGQNAADPVECASKP